MTTAERFRRRQRIEGFFLILLGIATIFYGVYDHHREADTRACVITTVTGLRDVSAAGRVANEIEQRASRQVISSALSGDIKSPEDIARVKDHYDRLIADAREKRLNAPLPPDPEKECQ